MIQLEIMLKQLKDENISQDEKEQLINKVHEIKKQL